MNARKKILFAIIFVVIFLFAATAWGAAIYFYTSRTPRLVPGAFEILSENPLVDSAIVRAFERRNSTPRGDFTGNEIDEDALLLLGWAATGKNRDGTGFVVPLAMGAEPYVELFLAQESGVRKFFWESNSFERVTNDDIRGKINSGQNASAIWIYVIAAEKLPRNNMNWAWHAIGAMSEHQYLLADELNIQARFMASINAEEVVALLGLDAEKNIPAGVMAMAQK